MNFVHRKNLDEHLHHLKFVLHVLRNERLYANLETIMFYKDHVTFLGLMVNSRGVQVDKEKIKAIQEWPTLKNVNELRSFMGLLVVIGGLLRTLVPI